MGGGGPCCGNDLQRGTRTVAIIQIGWNIFLLLGIALLFGLIVAGVGITVQQQQQQQQQRQHPYSTTTPTSGGDPNNNNELVHEEEEDDDKHEKMLALLIGVGLFFGIFFVVASIGIIVSLCLSCLLLYGANKRSYSICMIWLIFRLIMLAWSAGGVVKLSSNGWYYISTFELLDMALNSYFIWVVWAFMGEIKGGRSPALHPGVVYSVPSQKH